MKNEDPTTDRFCRLLLQGAVLTDPRVGFRTLCRWTGGRPGRLDRRLRDRFGLGGEALMELLRQQITAENQEKTPII